MTDLSARLSLPFLLPAQAQKHVTHNEALERLDRLVQLVVAGFDAITPPAAAPDGQIWALGAQPAGDWTGQGGKLACRGNGGWVFESPQTGWLAVQGTELRVFDGAAWVFPDPGLLQNLPGLGIGTSPDTTNRLAVASPATLLTHEGAGHQVKVNKAAAAETASLLFQTGWSGRAEMGLAGADDFSLKVSPDGTSFATALRADRATGRVTMPAGAEIAGPLTGTAVTQSATDTVAGRLMKVGDWGLGGDNAPAPPGGNLNNAIRIGFYNITSAHANNPFGSTGTLRVERSFNVVLQFVYGSSTTTYIRRSTDGGASWSSWTHAGAQTLGTVAQSGGAPAGALFERGSNANGAYVRFADGTQMCWTDSIVFVETAGGQRLDAPNWTYPAAFSANPEVNIRLPSGTQGTKDGPNWYATGQQQRKVSFVGCGPGQSSAVAPRIFSVVGQTFETGMTVTGGAVAVGRWF